MSQMMNICLKAQDLPNMNRIMRVLLVLLFLIVCDMAALKTSFPPAC